MTSLRKTACFSLILSACGLVSGTPGRAGEAGKGQEIKLEAGQRSRIESKITDDDPQVNGKRAKLYRVRLDKGKSYQIDLQSKDFDAYLYLRDAQGKVLAEDDDGGGGLNSRIVYTPDENAMFQIVATALDEGKTGDFALLVGEKGTVAKGTQELKLKDGKAEIMSALADGDPVEQNKICKVFTCKFTAGRSYRILQQSTDFDSYLYLLSPEGRILAQDDDSGGDLNSLIVHTPAASGTYRILATSLGGKDVGNFTISVTEGPGAKPAKVVELKFKDGKAETKGTLDNESPKYQGKASNPYALKFTAGKSYKIDMVSSDFDAYLYLVDKDGQVVGEDDDGGGDLNSRINYQAPQDGTYQVHACSLGNPGNGGYTLTITETGEGGGAKAGAGGTKAVALPLKAGKAEVKGQLTNDSPKFQGKHSKAYSVQFEEGKNYQIDMLSTDLDSYVYLVGKNNQVLAQDDDSGGDLNSRINFQAKESGLHTIYACSLGDVGNGNYTLTITESGTSTKAAPTVPAGKTETLKLTDGKVSVRGQLTGMSAKYQGKPAAAYRIDLEAGKAYRIDLASTEFDAFLYLLDPAGKLLAQDDDSGGDLNSRIIFSATQAGTYTIQACSLEPMGRGNYTLSIATASRVEQELASLEGRLRDLPREPAVEQKKIVEELRNFLQKNKDQAGVKGFQLAMGAAARLEFANPELAAEAYGEFGKMYVDVRDERMAELAQRMVGASRRLGLKGKEMELKGPTTDGEAFDLKKLRGKVVLVDFWATWCGPCVGEIPNMKAAYEKYHKKGFEIIGISLDQERSALTDFLKSKDLPWKSIYDRDLPPGKSLADFYGVMAIPLPILIDREGRVLSMNARGPELDRLLEELLGEKK